MARRRIPRSLAALGIVLGVIIVAALLFQWDWLIPIAERKVSAALGRPVTMSHLHVRLGRITHVVADDVAVANPDGFPDGSKFATVDHLGADVDVVAYIKEGLIRLPSIDVGHPVVDVRETKDGQANYKFASPSKPADSGSEAKAPQIGDLRIDDGHATVVIPKLRTDFAMTIATREQADKPAQLVVDAKGTYAGQPITGNFLGGALLSLRDAEHPYPIDLHAANGQTKLVVTGTVANPLNFAGANVKADIAGPDMAQLLPLTGVPLPETPPFHIAGNVDYADRRIRLTNFAGTVGKSDLEGTITVDPGTQRPDVTMDLHSRQVDLNDLGGLIGATPGDKNASGQSAQQKQEHARDAASSKLLPDTPLNVPKLQAADMHVKYRGDHIEGRSVPFDTLAMDLDIVDGAMRVHPATLGVGKGQIAGTFAIDPGANTIHVKSDVDFRQVDVSRMMASTHTFEGAGTIGGHAVFDGSGRSMAQMMAAGNGDLKLFMQGGDLSALLVSLSGLQFGNALANALGIPSKTQLRCMVIDMPLQRGVLGTNVFLIDTDQSNVNMTGSANLVNETLDYQIKTEPKHFSIGSLPAPIDIGGTFKDPSILPDPASVAARGGAAAVLGVLLTPLGALLPTIQLGLGEDSDCAKVIAQAGQRGANKLSSQQIRSRETRR